MAVSHTESLAAYARASRTIRPPCCQNFTACYTPLLPLGLRHLRPLYERVRARLRPPKWTHLHDD